MLDVDRSSVALERESVGVGVGSVSRDWRLVGGDRWPFGDDEKGLIVDRKTVKFDPKSVKFD